MEAIILAGGLGTRLQKILPDIPKPLAPIQNTPFLTLLLRQLEDSELFSKIILSLGFKSDQIIKYLETYSSSMPIFPLIEPEPLGTGGAVLYALPEVKGTSFCILNGDSYSDFCFRNFYQFHRNKNAEISIASYEMEDTSRYGTLQYDRDLRIIEFIEKENICQKSSISRGIYFCEKQLFDEFSLKEYSMEKDFFPLFLKKRMFAYPHAGLFIDVGTQQTYLEAQQILNPWIVK